MLGDKKASATVAVKDLAAARKFYEGTLGLSVEKEEPGGGGVMYKGGVFVYPSQFAGTNKATYVAWGVGDQLESLVEQLKGKGVAFEQYDNIPQVTRNGDIHTMGDLKAAWFKDPDGNILNLVNQM